ncbi:TonB-dependent receptor plug domain-containing protein [Pelagicoccus sp. SDUM812005]|uniref:TonB-dependent receptor plug domain-containing protein n=1 Tax=Pelagicoccus sp. SDUM812005 TaxID=3041257 RepID=UPI00280F6D27|nr:TonB-dependent receptor plug domain-containing protein [Pelagicoccus sp. SDUM812005]MDQ8183563.1 TonB-dependent receptor plug domain-containing protein [Pelagicoccus sp. SDUM812005]
MKNPHSYLIPLRKLALFASVPLVPAVMLAQEDEEEIFELSPFTVEGAEDQGYYSSQTMAGGRLRTELKDVATSVQVVTEQFIEDVGATSIDEILAYTTGTEAAGSMSDYLQVAGENGDLNQSETRQNPDAALRVRGLAAPTRTTNYFESAIPFNSYVSSRVDINRGANSFLFGLGSPGGIVNTSLQSAVLSDDSMKLSHRVSTENFESNYSQQFSVNMNKVLIEDKLAVRFAALEAEDEFMQKPAYKDEARRYFAVKFKPLAEHNINISANYEIGHTNAVPVDRLGPLETLTTFVDDPYGTQWGSTVDGEVTNAAGRRINDPFNNWRAGQSSTWLGLDANGEDIPLSYYQNQHLHRTGWMAVFDGSTGRTDGLADYGVDTGWLNTVAELNNPYYNPTNHNYSRNENVLVRNLHMGNIDTGLFPEYEGYRAQGLLDYEIFDFRKHLYSGSIDNYSTEFDRKMAFIDATTKDGRFGIEIAYNRENSSRHSFVVNGSPSIDIDVNYTNPAGPAQDPNDNTSLGVPNPNFGRLYFFAEASSNTRNADQREAMRATAFAKYDFADTFGEDSFLSKLGRHNLSVLLDESTVDTQRFNQKPMTFGNNANFHLATDATIFQRNASAIFYISDPYLNAFEDPNFRATDFYTTGAPAETILDYPSDYEIPLTYISRGNPETGEVSGALQQTKQGYYTPQFLDLGGVLTRTEVSSQAANLQSYYLGGHLVANLGYREDQVTQIRNNEPPRYGTDEGDVPGPAELDNVAILSPDMFRLEDGEVEAAPKTSTFGYGLVLKAPKKWLPEWLGLTAHYGESSNFSPNVGKFDFWGNSVPGASGETKDYGVTINLAGNKLVARINRYEAAMINGSFNDVNANAGSFVNQQGRFYGRYWDELMEYDRDLDGQFDDPTFDDGINPANGEPQGIAGDGIVDSNNLAAGEYLTLQQYHDIWNAYDNFWSDFVKETEDWKLSAGDADAGISPSFTRNVVVNGLLADTADLAAEGTELTLTWNPTKQLRLSVSASQQSVTRTNVAPRFERMLEEFVLAMSAVENGTRYRGNGANAMTLSLRDPFAGGTSIRTPLASGAQGQALFKAKALEGSTSPELAEHSFRVLGNYTFRDGFLKGVKMGAAHRWRDPTAIGYGRTTMTYLPGELDLEMNVVDVENPFYNEAKGSTDIWFGYNRKIFGDRAKWNVQLNIRNLFADSDPIVVQRQPDGTPNRVAIPAARQFVLSNSISF